MATRPGRLIETIPVPIARPRQGTVSLTHEFINFKELCMQLLIAAHKATLEQAA